MPNDKRREQKEKLLDLYMNGAKEGIEAERLSNEALKKSHYELLENLTRIVDRIKENGWAEEIPSAHDRAVKAIYNAKNLYHDKDKR